MTVQDMDICLNVSTNPVPATTRTAKDSRNKSEFFKPQYKRQLAKNKRKFGKINEDDNVEVHDNKYQNTGTAPEKRIKQKSLATIVNKNRVRVSNSKVNNPSVGIKKIVSSEKVDPAGVLSTKKLSKNASTCVDNQDKLNEDVEPLVSFTGASTGLRTILARPKRENQSKKSLSDIFGKSNANNDDDDGDSSIFSTNSQSRKPKKANSVVQKKNFTPGASSSMVDKPVNKRNTGQKFDKSFNKFTGKISSLFGNNPDVPNIGQRLVKPVNEPMFSKIKFSELNLHPYSISNLEQNMNITKPTLVQQKAIPQIASGKDVLIRSQTGSGKTLAYALPIVESLHKIRPKLTRNSGLKALVVVPTRELALQTYECFLKLIKPFTWIVPGYLIGGEKRKAEKARLRRGCSLLVATPGRLLDHIKNTEALKTNDVKCFVLDEADRMLDMGYEKDISEIVAALKGSLSSASNDEYDPMKIFRKNTKKIFNDDDNDAEKNPKELDEKIIEPLTTEEDKEISRKEYHSGSDSDTEDPTDLMEMKKIPKIQSTKTTVNEISENSNSSTRQTILLSATLTSAVEKLAGITMTDPVFIDTAEENLRSTSGNLNEINEDLIVPQGVVQSYVVTPPKLKMVTLSAYIAGKCQTSGQHKMLVFVATQDMVDYYTDILESVLSKPENDDDEDADPLVDVEFFKLHGSLSQKERTDVFKRFRLARSGVLFCTDVAARGLHLPKVDTVIQFTGPLSARDYVHRIGRTARAGSSGTAIIFLTPPEIEFIRMLESRRIRIIQEDMNDILNKLMTPLSNHHTVQAAATHLQNQFENLVVSDGKFYNAACKAYVSWVRFYASYPKDMRYIFDRKELHLGHYAKSFALRDPPQKIGGIGSKAQREKNPSNAVHKNRLSNERPEKRNNPSQREPQASGQTSRSGGILKRSRMLNVSEYGDGLVAIKKAKK